MSINQDPKYLSLCFPTRSMDYEFKDCGIEAGPHPKLPSRFQTLEESSWSIRSTFTPPSPQIWYDEARKEEISRITLERIRADSVLRLAAMKSALPTSTTPGRRPSSLTDPPCDRTSSSLSDLPAESVFKLSAKESDPIPIPPDSKERNTDQEPYVYQEPVACYRPYRVVMGPSQPKSRMNIREITPLEFKRVEIITVPECRVSGLAMLLKGAGLSRDQNSLEGAS